MSGVFARSGSRVSSPTFVPASASSPRLFHTTVPRRGNVGFRGGRFSDWRLFTQYARGDILSQTVQGFWRKSDGRNSGGVRTLSSTSVTNHSQLPAELSDKIDSPKRARERFNGGSAHPDTWIGSEEEEREISSFNGSIEDTILDGTGTGGITYHAKQEPPFKGEPGLDYKSLLEQSLQQRRRADLLRALVAACDDLEYIGSIPATTFSEIISLVQPRNLIDWADTIRNNLTPHMVTQMAITPPDHLINDYLHAITKVVVSRKKAGALLNVNDYSTLLATAYSARSRAVAEAFWSSMLADEVTPDMRCYNSYLGAIVQNAGKYAKSMYRVTEFHAKARSEKKLGADFVAYRFGEGGIKEQTLSVLARITKSETAPDAATYRLVILGVAREGDVGMVKGVLKNVWGVDVDALTDNVDEVYLKPRTDIPKDSPLYPRTDLLHAVAHAFGINNEISTAFRVVDYVSRTFGIPISRTTWEELFEWTFVLAAPRYGQSRFKVTTGQIPKDSLSKLWATMISEPYNAQPSITMYDKMIKMSLHLRRTAEIWYYMQEGLVLYKRSRTRAHQAQRKLGEATVLQAQGGLYSQLNVDKRRTNFAFHELLRKRDRVLVGRWCRLLLASMTSQHTRDYDQSWSIVQIPKILLKMKEYLPSVVQYDIPGGVVRIVFRQHEDMLDLGKKRIAVTNEKERLLNAAPLLPGSVMEVGGKCFRRVVKSELKCTKEEREQRERMQKKEIQRQNRQRQRKSEEAAGQDAERSQD